MNKQPSRTDRASSSGKSAKATKTSSGAEAGAILTRVAGLKAPARKLASVSSDTTGASTSKVKRTVSRTTGPVASCSPSAPKETRRKTGGRTRQEPTLSTPVDDPLVLICTPVTSKAATIMSMLQQADGTTLEAMQQATGWQAHSVRGFLSGTVKKRMALILASERGDDGIRRYRIADAAASAAAKA